ncbi:EamA family transporter [Tardiphaga sp. vice304]|uniref:EamA family transporter n=1 Tax=Tardiphaga sp. vice304 TaxID=2592817 RepID=UPI00143DAD35|nr:EamA family transporter [Tardiphaga sp. vice304]
MAKYFYISATLALTIYAQIMLKWRAVTLAPSVPGRKIDYLIAMYTDPFVLSVFVCALGASVSWALAIERMPLTLAYPFMALTFVLVPLGSVLLLRESFSPMQILGSALILVGITLSVYKY